MYQQTDIKLKTEKYVSLIKRLSSTFGPYAKISATHLACFLYNFLEEKEQKQELHKLFIDLGRSEHPTVRKSLAITLRNISQASFTETLKDLLNLLDQLSQDPNVLTRYNLIPLIEIMSELAKDQTTRLRLLSVIRDFQCEGNWKLTVGILEKIDSVGSADRKAVDDL
jgi:hypothetical protein